MPNEKKDLVFRIDGETGEIVSQFEIGEGESLTSSEKLHKRKIFMEKKNEMECFNNQMGGFVKLFYVNEEILFQNVLEPQEVARFLYISTFIDYDNVLKNDKGEPLTKKTLWKLTFMRPSVFNQLYEKLTNENFLFENKNETISVNDEKVTKGDHKMKNVSYTRMYINTIRKLYKGCDQRQHKSLGYLFKLVPFLDYESNMICYKNDEKFSPMTTEDMMMLLDISCKSSGSVSQFNRQLMKLKVSVNGKDVPVFGKISFESCNGKLSNGWVVNPCLFYHGNKIENVNFLLKKLFELSNK